MSYLTRAECDDAADRVVWRDPDGHAVAWDDLDTETTHTAAQLCEHFVPCVALNPIETSAMDRHYCALHVD
jgi:hypothetical protein